MTLDDMRSAMRSVRVAADSEADSMKDPYLAVERMSDFYGGLDASTRRLADAVLCEWALSANENLRFDAIALIRQFDVVSARSSLLELARRLSQSGGPSAPFERQKVEQLISDLSADD